MKTILILTGLLLCGSTSAQRLEEPTKVYVPAWPTCDAGKPFDAGSATQAASSEQHVNCRTSASTLSVALLTCQPD
jgi:hypothetical protein